MLKCERALPPSLLHVWSGWAAKELGQALHKPTLPASILEFITPWEQGGLAMLADHHKERPAREQQGPLQHPRPPYTLLTPPCLAMLMVPASRIAKAQKIQCFAALSHP